MPGGEIHTYVLTDERRALAEGEGYTGDVLQQLRVKLQRAADAAGVSLGDTVKLSVELCPTSFLFRDNYIVRASAHVKPREVAVT